MFLLQRVSSYCDTTIFNYIRSLTYFICFISTICKTLRMSVFNKELLTYLKGRPSSCFVTIGRGNGCGSNGQKTSKNNDCLHFVLPTVGAASVAKCWRQKPPNFAIGYPVNMPNMQIHEGTWLVDQHCGNGCSINRAPPLWWQSAIAFAGSCTLSEYFASSLLLYFVFCVLSCLWPVACVLTCHD